MKSFKVIRDWVDRQWRGSSYKVLMLPAVVPFLVISMMDYSPAHWVIGWGWFGLWNSFVWWRHWLFMREMSQKADEEYDRIGKFRLAQEYHHTESATAAAKRRRRKEPR